MRGLCEKLHVSWKLWVKAPFCLVLKLDCEMGALPRMLHFPAIIFLQTLLPLCPSPLLLLPGNGLWCGLGAVAPGSVAVPRLVALSPACCFSHEPRPRLAKPRGSGLTVCLTRVDFFLGGWGSLMTPFPVLPYSSYLESQGADFKEAILVPSFVVTDKCPTCTMQRGQ